MRYHENVKEGFVKSLNENNRYLSEMELDDLLSERLSGLTESQSEMFLGTLSSIGDSELEGFNFSNIFQGAAQGAALGSAGGPYAMAAGAALGGIMGALKPSTTPTPPAATTPTPPAATTPTPPAATTPTPPAATNVPQAALKLFELLKNRKMDEVLAALLLGSDGKDSVQVGKKSVEIGEFLNSLKNLSSAAVDEVAERYATSKSYIESEDELDYANPDVRSDYLLDLLRSEKESAEESISSEYTQSNMLTEGDVVYIDLD